MARHKAPFDALCTLVTCRCHMCMRSYANRRELATELAREVLPQLQGTGTKLLLFSIGTPERGREFAAKTGFPEELLMADPYSETYAAVGDGAPVAMCTAPTPLHGGMRWC